MSGFKNQSNLSRVERITAFLKLMHTSAVSNGATPEEVSDLLGPVFDQMGRMGIASAVINAKLPNEETRQPTETPPVEATPPVAREMSALGDLSTQQLVDRMIACGAELANRRQ